MYAPKNILVPTDFSEESRLAFEWALTVAKQATEPSRVTIFPAYISSNRFDPLESNVDAGDYQGLIEAWAKREMMKLASNLEAGVAVVPVYAMGDAAEEVANLCYLKDIDLVVMATQGRRGLAQLFHRSVAERVVRLAPCPVLVIHKNRPSAAPPPRVASAAVT